MSAFNAPPPPTMGADGAPNVDTSRCLIPNCPSCKNAHGAKVCGTTGEAVWPPLDADAAQGMATGVLRGIRGLLSMFLSDRDIPEPSSAQISMLARGILKMQQRRASWISAYDDLVLIAMGLGGYTLAAIYAPPKVKALPSSSSSSSSSSTAEAA